MRYETKVEYVDAYQLHIPREGNLDFPSWLFEACLEPMENPIARYTRTKCPNSMVIRSIMGELTAIDGDWIIKDDNGEIYVCSDSVFKEKYKPICSDWSPKPRHPELEKDLQFIQRGAYEA